MTDIKLTPETLLAQSKAMKDLQQGYEDVFRRASKVLNDLNSCWSDDLANNFEGKITGAQKNFSSVTNMLTNGSTAARVSAMTFTHPNSILSTLHTDGGLSLFRGNNQSGLSEILTDDEKQQIIDLLPPDLRKSASDAASVEKWLASEYNNLPKDVRKSIESALPSDFKNTVSVINDVAQGKANSKTLEKVVTVATGNSNEGKMFGAVWDAGIKASFMKGDPKLMNEYNSYEKKSAESFQNGNYTEGLKYFGKAYVAECKDGLRKIGYGLADGYTNLASVGVDAVTKKPLDFAEKLASGIPGDIGEYAQTGVETVKKFTSGVSSRLWNLL